MIEKMYLDMVYPKSFLSEYGTLRMDIIGEDKFQTTFIYIRFDQFGNPVKLGTPRIPGVKTTERRFPVRPIDLNEDELVICLTSAINDRMERYYSDFRARMA